LGGVWIIVYQQDAQHALLGRSQRLTIWHGGVGGVEVVRGKVQSNDIFVHSLSILYVL
jgi:hypothetical protein